MSGNGKVLSDTQSVQSRRGTTCSATVTSRHSAVYQQLFFGHSFFFFVLRFRSVDLSPMVLYKCVDWDYMFSRFFLSNTWHGPLLFVALLFSVSMTWIYFCLCTLNMIIWCLASGEFSTLFWLFPADPSHDISVIYPCGELPNNTWPAGETECVMRCSVLHCHLLLGAYPFAQEGFLIL